MYKNSHKNRTKLLKPHSLLTTTSLLLPFALVVYLALPISYKAGIYKYYSQLTLRSYNKYATKVLHKPIPISYTSEEVLLSKINSPAPWAVAQIEHDFANYSDASVANVQKTFDAFPADKLLVKFDIKDGKLTVTRKDIEMNGACTRGLEIYTNIFDYMARQGYVKDVSFLIRLTDFFYDTKDLSEFNFAPIMTTTRNPNLSMDSKLVLIPDYMSLEDIPRFAPRILHANKLYPWAKKDNKVLWRGGYADVSGYRQKIVEYSQLHPEGIVDAKWAEDKNSPNFLHPEYQVKSKLLLNVDGHGPAWTRPIWQLLSNSVMVKQQSDLTQWYYQALQPDVHYIVVPLDPNELEPTLSKYSDEQLQTIAMHGHEFANNNLLIDDMVSYLILAVQKYEQLQAQHNVQHS